MRMKLCALALAGLAMGSAASAQAPVTPVTPVCPKTEDALQIAVNNYFEAVQPDARPDVILPRVEEIVKVCPKDPYPLKVAATIYATIKSADAKTAVARLARSREIFRQMWRNLKGSNPPILVMGPDDQPINYSFDDLYQTETQVRQLLFTAEQISGELAPEDMPIGKGAPMRSCESNDFVDAQQAYLWLKDKDHPGAFNLLDREVQYCAAEIDKGQYPQILTQRARSLIASAKRAGIDKPESLTRLKQARADADRYLLIRKGAFNSLDWWNTDDTELSGLLMQAMMKQGAAPPKEAWFKPPLLADPMTKQVIAMTLDAAWAEDSKVGISGAYKTYRGVMSSAYGLAMSSADPKAARKLLFTAAKDQADGKIRGPGNAGLKAPPSFLYTWIDPDFVAPASAPSPSATPTP